MKFLPSLLAAMTLAAITASPALASQELATKKACMACHGIDNTMVGPAFKEVAKRYKGQKGIEAKLAEKVMKGGKGVWFPDRTMPANPTLTAAEAKQLVSWIMALK